MIVALAMGLLFSSNILLTVILIVVAVAAWFLITRVPREIVPAQIEDAPITHHLFASGEASNIWLPVRIALGWAWLQRRLDRAGSLGTAARTTTGPTTTTVSAK